MTLACSQCAWLCVHYPVSAFDRPPQQLSGVCTCVYVQVCRVWYVCRVWCVHMCVCADVQGVCRYVCICMYTV